jgi:hypothetical protein
LRGIWTVDRLSIDGVERAPLVIDNERWRRIVFDRPEVLAFQRMDDTLDYREIAFDPGKSAITIMKGAAGPGGFFLFDRTGGQLSMTGQVDGRRIAMHLTRMADDAFPLQTRGFHWIQELPFNR